MPIDRRTFLKRIGGGLLAVAAAPLIVPTSAPLFIPSDRLEMGVPRRLAAAIASGAPPGASLWGVPMRLNQDEFLLEWGGRLPAGSIVTVDEGTARRWIGHRIGAPTESWMRSAPPDLERAVLARATPDPWRFRTAEEIGTTMPIPSSTPPDGEWFRQTALTILAEDAYAPV
jgi:hypothetical protein